MAKKIFVVDDEKNIREAFLSSVAYQIFHSEHDRLVDYIKNVLTADAHHLRGVGDGQAAVGVHPVRCWPGTNVGFPAGD